MNKTKIEYLTHTWNPLAMRCTPVSKGCKNCWHLRMADRLAKNPKIPEYKRNIYAGGCWAELCRWNHPMLLKKPAIVGVQFMGDIAHPTVQRIDFSLIFDMMRQAPQHTYLMLTKRPFELAGLVKDLRVKIPENCWLGVTVEDQETADNRIPALLQIPAAHHWVSYEPALGPVDMAQWFPSQQWTLDGGIPNGVVDIEFIDGIEFVVAGGESGPGARPAHPDWFRSVRDQCKKANVPFMFKQWGAYVPCYEAVEGWWCRLDTDGNLIRTRLANNTPIVRCELDDYTWACVGKKKAGRLLDGREHMEMPWQMPT